MFKFILFTLTIVTLTSCTNKEITNLNKPKAVTAFPAGPIACTVLNSWIAHVATVSGTVESGCQVETCEANYEEVNNTCEPILCTNLNANISNSLTVSGNMVDGCTLDTCEANYLKVNNTCQAIACTVNNSGILHASQVSGTLAAGCTVTQCEDDFEIIGNSCEVILCNLSNAQGNGVSDITNVIAVDGYVLSDMCKVTQCADYYTQSPFADSCIAKTCTDLTNSELSTLGYNLTAATISGTYPTCSLTCTSTSQQLAADGKSCEDIPEVNHYSLLQLTSNNLVYQYELSALHYDFTFVFENTSYKTVGGANQGKIPMLSPILLNPSYMSVSPITVGYNGYPLCNQITTIPAGGRCEINLKLDYTMPAVGSPLEDVVSTMQVYSPQSGQTLNQSVSFKRLFNQTSSKKLVVSFNHGQGDYSAANMQENGWTKGMSLGVIDLGTRTSEYVAPCMVKADGTAGDPRGVDPYYNSEEEMAIKIIGNKVYFAGRGCSHNGTQLVYDRIALWEFDSDLPILQGSNPRKISRNMMGTTSNYPNGSHPSHTMKVLNNKLYYMGNTLYGTGLNPFNDDNIALFEFDPSQPLSGGVNPKEVITGYSELEAVNGNVSSPRNIYANTTNNKIYFTGLYYTTGIDYGGVIEYDPTLPITQNDPSLMEANDNPKVAWGVDHSIYPYWNFNFNDMGLYADNEIVMVYGQLPASFVAMTAQSDPQKSLLFYSRANAFSQKYSLCGANCDDEVMNIHRFGSKLVMRSKFKRPNSFIDRTIVSFNTFANAGGLVSQMNAVTDLNTSGGDLSENVYFHRPVAKGTKLYFAGKPDSSRSTLYTYDSTNNAVTRVFTSTPFYQTEHGFNRIKILNNDILGFTFQATSGTAPYGMGLYQTNMPMSGTSPIVLNANYLRKTRFYTSDVAEDSNFYYFTYNIGCSDGSVAWNIEVGTKILDVSTLNTLYPSDACSKADKRLAERILLVK